MEVESRKQIASRTAIAIALVALILTSLLAAFEYTQVASVQRKNETLSPKVDALVDQSFSSHLSKLESLNPSEALTDYESNATLILSGNTLGVRPAIGTETAAGSEIYTGVDEIEEPLGGLFGENSSLGSTTSVSPESWKFTIDSLTTVTLANGSATIAANVMFVAQSHIFGNFNGTIVSHYLYVFGNGAWLIRFENWNITMDYVQNSFGD